jgi:hypothetical protein
MNFSAISYSLLPHIILLLLFSFLIGHVLLEFTKFKKITDPFLDTFSKLLIGLFTIIVLHSAVITKGITIQWGFFIVGCMAVYLNKKLNQNKSAINLSIKNNLTPIVVLLLLVLIVYIFQGGLFYNEPYNNIPHGDYAFYSTIVEGYNFYGIETRDTVINTMRTNYSPAMYHHTDLWIGSIFYTFSNTLSIETLLIGGYTSLLSVLALGLISLSRCFTNNKIIHFISPLLVMFYGFPILKIIPQIETFVFGIGFNTKNIINALLFLPAIMMLVKKNPLFIIPLLALPIVNIINLPSVFGTLMLLGGIHLFKRDSNHEMAKYWIIFPLVVSFFIVLFYFITKFYFPTNISSGFTLNDIIKGLTDYPSRPLLIVFGAIACILILYFFPFLLLSIISFKKDNFLNKLKESNLLYVGVFVLLIGFIGLSTWALLNILKDSAQFFYMPFLTALNILVFIAVFKAIQYLKNKATYTYKIVLVGFIAMIILNYALISNNNPFVRFSPLDFRAVSYMEYVKLELEKEKKPVKIAYIINPEKFKEFWSAIPYHQPNEYVKLLVSGTKQVSLNTLDIPIDSFTAQQKATLIRESEQSPFGIFVNNLKKDNMFESYNKARLNFIENNNIKYLIIDSEMIIPEELFPIITHIKTDEMSGEKFITLKY